MKGINMKRRERVCYGFKSYTAKVWCDAHVDSYNAIQDHINTFIDAGAPVPEYLINGSHNLMISYSVHVQDRQF